ncbi:MAG: cytochrome c3 family protein [Candidatus Eisenbacteria bacterium]|nr:cytochrome c3 family protein [Candidatus Eisenbacteria bacterium]
MSSVRARVGAHRILASLSCGLSALILLIAAAPAAAVDHPETGNTACIKCHNYSAVGIESLEQETSLPHDSFVCLRCHEMHSWSGNLQLVRATINTPNSGPRAVLFRSHTGTNSFADGDGTYNGVCEVCHTRTYYHRNNSSGDHFHNASTDCTACHPHPFFHPTGGTCLDCHNRTQPFLAGDYRRQVVVAEGVGGDFILPSHHVTDGSTTQVVSASDCVVCHDQSQHRSFTGGVGVLLRDADGGAPIGFDGTAASLEAFCVNCHDGGHAAPFLDGRPAVNVAGMWAGATHHTAGVTCAQCHGNGHGNPNAKMLLAATALRDNTTYSTFAYSLCWMCHSEQKIINGTNSFAQLHKKHVVEKKAPCTACHSGHGAQDAGEPGQVNFSYALANGFDLQMIDGNTPSTAFHVSGDDSKGYCYLRCHGQDHKPKFYDRTGMLPLVKHTEGEEPGDTPVALHLRALANPARGQASFVVEASGMGLTQTTRLTVYDVAGRIQQQFDVAPFAGRRVIRWDGSDRSGRLVPNGVYLARLETYAGAQVFRLMFMR